MARCTVIVGAALALLMGLASTADASWAYIPPPVLMAEADGIVVGKMTKVDAAEGTGVIAVAEVLKGDKALKEVKAQFSAIKGGLVHSAMITYADGTEGVWILQKKNDAGAYIFNYPLLHQDKSKVAEVKEQLNALENRKWSEPVKGLAASCIVLPSQGTANQMTALVFVMNAGEKPLRVSNYVGSRVLEVTLVAPDGTEKKLDLYAWLAAARLAAPREADYPELAPGASRIIGMPHGVNVGPMDKEGVYKVRAAYVSTGAGEALKLENVWTGRVEAPEVAIKR